MSDNDWEPVVIRGRGVGRSAGVAPSLDPRAPITRAAGGRAIVPRRGEKACDAAHAAKLERSDMPAVRSLSPSTRHALTTARVAGGMTQAQLNTRAALPVNCIRDFENGRACPTPAQLNKLNSILRTSLHYAR